LGPKCGWITVNHGLQIAQLVRQADLALLGGGLQLCSQAITDPDFGLALAHHVLDDIHTAVETDPMQDRRQAAEHPMPPVRAIHPARMTAL